MARSHPKAQIDDKSSPYHNIGGHVAHIRVEWEKARDTFEKGLRRSDETAWTIYANNSSDSEKLMKQPMFGPVLQAAQQAQIDLIGVARDISSIAGSLFRFFPTEDQLARRDVSTFDPEAVLRTCGYRIGMVESRRHLLGLALMQREFVLYAIDKTTEAVPHKRLDWISDVLTQMQDFVDLAQKNELYKLLDYLEGAMVGNTVRAPWAQLALDPNATIVRPPPSNPLPMPIVQPPVRKSPPPTSVATTKIIKTTPQGKRQPGDMITHLELFDVTRPTGATQRRAAEIIPQGDAEPVLVWQQSLASWREAATAYLEYRQSVLATAETQYGAGNPPGKMQFIIQQLDERGQKQAARANCKRLIGAAAALADSIATEHGAQLLDSGGSLFKAEFGRLIDSDSTLLQGAGKPTNQFLSDTIYFHNEVTRILSRIQPHFSPKQCSFNVKLEDIERLADEYAPRVEQFYNPRAAAPQHESRPCHSIGVLAQLAEIAPDLVEPARTWRDQYLSWDTWALNKMSLADFHSRARQLRSAAIFMAASVAQRCGVAITDPEKILVAENTGQTEGMLQRMSGNKSIPAPEAQIFDSATYFCCKFSRIFNSQGLQIHQIYPATRFVNGFNHRLLENLSRIQPLPGYSNGSGADRGSVAASVAGSATGGSQEKALLQDSQRGI